MYSLLSRNRWPLLLLAIALIVTLTINWPGLHGAWLFDDYPNIVDNKGVQPTDASVPSLMRAALSLPSSEFKRPLASLSFAANYLVSGLAPLWWKLTNLFIHLLNGVLVFWLARMLLRVADARVAALAGTGAGHSNPVTHRMMHATHHASSGFLLPAPSVARTDLRGVSRE